MPAGDNGKCPDTLRYYTLIYITNKQKEYFCHVTCKDIDMLTMNTDDLTLEFLAYKDWNPFVLPYDAELFDEIITAAKVQLKETKEEEWYSGAV